MHTCYKVCRAVLSDWYWLATVLWKGGFAYQAPPSHIGPCVRASASHIEPNIQQILKNFKNLLFFKLWTLQYWAQRSKTAQILLIIYRTRARFTGTPLRRSIFYLHFIKYPHFFEVWWNSFDVVRFIYKRGLFLGEGKSCARAVDKNQSPLRQTQIKTDTIT